ncbi:hypothetical protein ACMYYO_03360 [Dermacoccaceae bacterium W4C1]
MFNSLLASILLFIGTAMQTAISARELRDSNQARWDASTQSRAHREVVWRSIRSETGLRATAWAAMTAGSLLMVFVVARA